MRNEPGRHSGEPGRRTAPPGARAWILGLLVGGVLAVLFGFAGFSSVQGLRTDGVTTDAEVVGVTRVKSSASYSLRYALEDRTVVTCSTGDVVGDPAPGDTVRVLYERGYPDVNCQSADYGNGFEAPITFIVGGGGMIVVALGLHFFSRERAA